LWSALQASLLYVQCHLLQTIKIILGSYTSLMHVCFNRKYFFLVLRFTMSHLPISPLALLVTSNSPVVFPWGIMHSRFISYTHTCILPMEIQPYALTS
jgi:hypothetical protein